MGGGECGVDGEGGGGRERASLIDIYMFEI